MKLIEKINLFLAYLLVFLFCVYAEQVSEVKIVREKIRILQEENEKALRDYNEYKSNVCRLIYLREIRTKTLRDNLQPPLKCISE